MSALSGKIKIGANIPASANAFTMVEVIVAMAVLGISLVAIFGVLSLCARASYHNRMLTQAVLLAQTQLATVRLVENPRLGVTDGQNDRFQWKVELAQTAMDNLAAVKVDVTWQEQQRPQRYQLLSLLKLKTF